MYKVRCLCERAIARSDLLTALTSRGVFIAIHHSRTMTDTSNYTGDYRPASRHYIFSPNVNVLIISLLLLIDFVYTYIYISYHRFCISIHIYIYILSLPLFSTVAEQVHCDSQVCVLFCVFFSACRVR